MLRTDRIYSATGIHTYVYTLIDRIDFSLVHFLSFSLKLHIRPHYTLNWFVHLRVVADRLCGKHLLGDGSVLLGPQR